MNRPCPVALLVWAFLAASAAWAEPPAPAAAPEPVSSAPVSAFEAQPALGPEEAEASPASAASSSPASPAATPGRTPDAPNLGTYLSGVATVLLLLAGMLGLARAWRNGRGLAPSSGIRLLGQKSIAPGASVCLVEVGNKVLRVGLHRSGMTYLGEIADADEVAQLRALCLAAAPAGEPGSFNRTLDEAVRTYETAPASVRRRVETMDEIRSQVGRIHGSIRSMRDALEGDALEPETVGRTGS